MADTKTTAAKAAGGKSSAKKQKTTIRKKKAKLGFTKGVAHIHASFNNTIVSISDPTGHVIAWASAGSIGYTGARKSTPFAAQLASQQVAHAVMERGLKSVDVIMEPARIRPRGQQHDHRRAALSGFFDPFADPPTIGRIAPDVVPPQFFWSPSCSGVK